MTLDLTKSQKSSFAPRSGDGLLLEGAAAAVVQLDAEGKVQLWNQSAERLFGWRAEEVLGKPSPGVPNDLWEDNQAWFLRCLGGQSLAGIQMRRRRKDGSQVDLHAWAWPTRNDQGQISGVMKMFFPVGDQRLRPITTADQLLQRQTEQARRFHSVLVDLGKTDHPNLESALRKLTMVTAKTLDVQRVSIWFFNEDRSAIRCFCLYKLNEDQFESGTVLSAEKYPQYFAALEVSRSIAAKQARKDPRTKEYEKEYLIPLDIQSMLDVPIRLHGKEIGIVCHEHIGIEREWTQEEQAFAGTIADFVSLALENHEHAKAEQALRESESTLHSFVENCNARTGIAKLLDDGDLEIIWGNRLLHESWPCVGKQKPCKLSQMQIEPELAGVWRLAALEAQTKQQPVRFEAREDKTGRWLVVTLAPIRSAPEGRVCFIIGDNTDFRTALEERNRNEQLLSAIINGSPIGIQVFDQEGTLRRQNPSMEQLLRLAGRDERIDQFNILQPGPDHGFLDPQRLRRAFAGQVVEDSQCLSRPDMPADKPLDLDQAIYLETLYYPIFGRQGESAGVAGFTRDVSERRRLDEQVQQKQRLESLGLLAGTIAHDFNGLLTAILGFVDLANLELAEGHLAKTYLRSAMQAVTQATDLTQQLLAYAGKGGRERKAVDLSLLVLEVAEILRSMIARHAQLQLDLLPSPPAVIADETQAKQVIMNLISNAAESHTNGLQPLHVRTFVRSLSADDLQHCQVVSAEALPGEYLAVEVKDAGDGIPAEIERRIFEPFYTTKSRGRGLGLAAVVGIIRSHRGALSLESRPGQGSRFSVFFPVKTEV